MKNILIITLLTLSFVVYASDGSYKKTMDVIHEYSQALEKEQAIICTSYGLDYAGPDKIYDGKIHTIALGYRIDANLKLEAARKLFYLIVDGLLDHLNKNQEIRPYLFHYPVSYRDLEFHLSFDYERKNFLKINEVNSIHISDNEVTYFIVDQEGPRIIDTGDLNKNFGSFFEKHRSITKRLPQPKD